VAGVAVVIKKVKVKGAFTKKSPLLRSCNFYDLNSVSHICLSKELPGFRFLGPVEGSGSGVLKWHFSSTLPMIRIRNA